MFSATRHSTVKFLLGLSLLAGQVAHASSGSCLDLKAFEGTYRVDPSQCDVPYTIVFGENPVIEGRPSLLPEDEFVITADCDRLVFTTANKWSNGAIVLVNESFDINEDGVKGKAKVDYSVKANLIVADEETKRGIPLLMNEEITAKWSLEVASSGSRDLLYKSDMRFVSWYGPFRESEDLKHKCAFKRQ